MSPTSVKRSIDDVAEPEQNSRTVSRKTETNSVSDDSSAPDFARIAYPHSAPPKTPIVQYPHQLTTFSYTVNHELEFTNSAMRFYCDAPLGADLSYRYDKWVKKPESRGRLDGLLRACLQDAVSMERKRANIITWRGVMTKIMTAPYEDQGAWDLNVMEVDETLYFEEHTSDEKLAEKEDLNPRRRMQTYYGYAFESYSTARTPNPSEDPEKEPNGWGGDVNTNVQWCSIVKSKLDNLRTIIGGEVDCVDGRYSGQPDTFVELKTSQAITRPRDEMFFEKKLLKFYFQSFLLGVPNIKVGFRTTTGRITTIQSFKTTDLPRMVRGKPHAWDPNVCLAWAKSFFDFVRDSIKSHPSSNSVPVGNGEGKPPSIGDSKRMARHIEVQQRVWRITFHPGKGAQMCLLDDEGAADVRNNEERVGFLPQWYWKEVVARDLKSLPEHGGA